MGFHWPEIILLLITVLWLAALVHCITNKWLRGSEKVAWIPILLFVNWLGALSYFIYWYGFAKRKRSQIVLPAQPRATPYEPNHSPYEQGYQPIRTHNTSQVKPFSVERGEQEEMTSPFYEQSQVMYPEDPR